VAGCANVAPLFDLGSECRAGVSLNRVFMTQSDCADLIDADRPLPPPLRLSEHFALAAADFRHGLRDWRAWVLLGMNDIRQRYRRSRLGQFWITLSMAVTIVSLGVVYAYLFNIPVHEYLPYLAVSFVAWGTISNIVIEACGVFTGAEIYLRQVPMPKTVFVHRMLVRNAVTLAHNALILPPLFYLFDVPVHWTILLALIGVVLMIVNGIWVGLMIGTLCARFRDMPQTIASIMQIVFYVTPIMWRPSQIVEHLSWLTDYNPFASFLSLVRDPLLGTAPRLWDWAVVGAVTVLGFLIAIPFFARFRARIVYWL
jgi:ABC-type polysaccharide/polyol phosphate export permease